MAANSYTLEHFYRGQLVREGKPEGEPRLLASSAGVKPEQVAEAMQLALIPPMAENPIGAVALARGKSGAFYFVQAQVGGAGQYMTHVALLPSELIRALSGNLKSLVALVQQSMPTFDSAGGMLPLMPFLTAEPPSAEQQTTAMLALMSAARDRIQTLDKLLASVVTNTPLAVYDAPPELDKRIAFIEGLMALLPPPARPPVTFTTHATPQLRPDTVITFYGEGEPPSNALIYRWGDTSTSGIEVSDEYARFITSQLRLDTTLVLDQTNALTPVAAWRLHLGEGLSAALHYASKRLKIDDAVQNNLPIELDDAAQILADDPTLTDALRLAYVQHMLKLALPLEAHDYLQQLGHIARGTADLENTLLEQVEEALDNSAHTGAIYRALVGWVGESGGFSGMLWIELAQRSARQHTEALAKARDASGLAAFLNEVADTTHNPQIATVVAELVGKALPIASEDANLARVVTGLAARVYSTELFSRLLGLPDVVAQLPPVVAELKPHLTGETSGAARGLLANAANAFDPDARELLAIRFAEIAILKDRAELVDGAALQLLAQAAEGKWSDAHDAALRWIARGLAGEANTRGYDEEAERNLLRILLARQAYADFATSLLAFARRYQSVEEGQTDFTDFIRGFFAEVTLTPDALSNALQALSVNGLKPLPLMHAYYGALQRAQWTPPFAPIASELNTLMVSNILIAAQAPPPMLLAMIKYHTERLDLPAAVRIAELLPEIAAKEGEGGITPMLRVCGLLREDEATRAIAINLLRRFVRRLPGGVDRRAAARLSEKLGEKVKVALDGTLLIKRIFDGLPIEEYAGFLHVAANLLHDTTVAYVEKDRVPGLKMLLGDLDSLNGHFSDDDRRALGREVLDLGKAVVAIAAKQRSLRPRANDAQTEALIAGTANASAPLDVLLIVGGYFSRGKTIAYRIEQSFTGHPLGARAAPEVLSHTEVTLRLLRSFARAFPSEGRWVYSADAIRAELESIWEEVSLAERRRLVQNLVLDFQRLPALIAFIAEKGNTRALQDDDRVARKLEEGDRKPENTLELYRLISGYFRARVRTSG